MKTHAVIVKFNLHKARIAKVGMICIFLALIRCIAECFRLHYVLDAEPGFESLKPYLIGALISAVSNLIMVILYFFSQYKTIILMSILSLFLLLLVKILYQ